MRPTDSSFLPPERSIGRVRTTSLICGGNLTLVRQYIIVLSLLTRHNFSETAEEADSHEALEIDDEGYPRLPENVLELRHRPRKAVLRQYVAAVRRMYHTQHTMIGNADRHLTGFYKLNGRIPWLDIAKNPSHYLSKKSQPYCDYKLEEPSHMKSDGVDAWLQHWLKLQKKKKRPLELKDPSNKSSEPLPTTSAGHKRKAKRPKDQYIETDDSNDEESSNEAGDGGSNEDRSNTTNPDGQHPNGDTQPTVLPPSPSSASLTRDSRRTFLQSLSDDKKYQRMIGLLGAAEVSN
jgi:hypothetical protein